MLAVKLDDVAFANADIAGSVSGTYRGGAKGVRGVDLTGRLARAEGKQVYRYIPQLDPEVAELAEAADPGGDGGRDEVPPPRRSRRLPVSRAGERRVQDQRPGDRRDARVRRRLAEAHQRHRRPRLRRPEAEDLEPAGERARHADREHRRRRCPTCSATAPTSIVDGEVNGPLGEFLKFIAQSPVRGMIHGLTDPWSGDGRASLKLHLELPLYAIDAAKVAGSFQFANNSIALGPGEPTLAQVNGRVEFTETGASARGITAQTLGGNINLQVSTRDAVTTSVIQGTVDSRELARSVELPIADAPARADAVQVHHHVHARAHRDERARVAARRGFDRPAAAVREAGGGELAIPARADGDRARARGARPSRSRSEPC